MKVGVSYSPPSPFSRPKEKGFFITKTVFNVTGLAVLAKRRRGGIGLPIHRPMMVGVSIMVKRIYDMPEPGDGYRVLVDRLWPRGMSRERAALDLWLKDIAPSPGLRKWFGHDPARFAEFAERYRTELDANAETITSLRNIIMTHETVTLLYSAKNLLVNHAVVLRDYMAGGTEIIKSH